MKQWVAAIAAAVGGLAACQVTPAEETSIQALTGDPCSAQMPTPKPWKGSKVYPAGELEAWVMWPNAKGKLAATGGGEWLAALVDNKAGVVRAAYVVSDTQYETFLSRVARGRIAGPGTTPPPPPCEIPLLCGRMLVAYGRTLLSAADNAYEDALACEP